MPKIVENVSSGAFSEGLKGRGTGSKTGALGAKTLENVVFGRRGTDFKTGDVWIAGPLPKAKNSGKRKLWGAFWGV